MATTSAEARANVPDFRLSVDGLDFSDKVRPRLQSLSLTERRGGEADELTLVLDDSDGKLALPRKKAEIKLELGWKQGAEVKAGLVPKGRFTVDQVDWDGPPDKVTITARSADLTAGFRKRREDKHRDTTLGDLARKIAGRHGYQAKVAPEIDGIQIPVQAQHHKSDMALLRQLGKEHDAVATVKDRKLILAPIGKGTSASGKSLPTLQLKRSDVSDYRYSEMDRSGEAGVEARWHDKDSNQRKTVKSGGAGKGEPRRLRRVYHSEKRAKQAAEAEAKRAKRAEGTFAVSLPLGRPDLVPEQPMTAKGFKDKVDAKSWIIAELTHTLDEKGLGSKVSFEVRA